ncbi:hypothetical protein DER29_4322 [Micromonospora sp. M71_S20]|uniref:hypothetical protein n=1 Tax=Micromonospora sp. M71_S20 TaxID=592872 RepID=UPI000EAEC302|nr:hypothetical protein [Micromonospora sp. M71_S20]RLK13305.1 hypothetical protein DER29_4322 [Micromonospora sp. M71_S20]
MAETPEHVALTLDGSLDDYGVRPGAMRWMPPEKAAAFRAANSPDAVRRRTIQLASHVRQALAEQARP